jgi:hypothetical protein
MTRKYADKLDTRDGSDRQGRGFLFTAARDALGATRAPRYEIAKGQIRVLPPHPRVPRSTVRRCSQPERQLQSVARRFDVQRNAVVRRSVVTWARYGRLWTSRYSSGFPGSRPLRLGFA